MPEASVRYDGGRAITWFAAYSESRDLLGTVWINPQDVDVVKRYGVEAVGWEPVSWGVPVADAQSAFYVYTSRIKLEEVRGSDQPLFNFAVVNPPMDPRLRWFGVKFTPLDPRLACKWCPDHD